MAKSVRAPPLAPVHPAINPRGNIRQRGDRLVVTCSHPFFQLLVLAGTLRAQL
jgi:hypothetical protein